MRTAWSKEQGVLGGEAAVLGRDGGQSHRSNDIVHALKEKTHNYHHMQQKRKSIFSCYILILRIILHEA